MQFCRLSPNLQKHCSILWKNFFQIQYLRRVLLAITGIHSLWEVSKYSVTSHLFSSLNRNLASYLFVCVCVCEWQPSMPWSVMHENTLFELLFWWQCNMQMSIIINHWNSIFCIFGSFSKHLEGFVNLDRIILPSVKIWLNLRLWDEESNVRQ